MMRLIRDDLKEREVRAIRKVRLSNDDYLCIVWGLSRGLTYSDIARSVKCSIQTALDYKDLITKEPWRVFELPVMVKRSERKYLCRFCGGVEPSEIGCKRHILKHFLPLEYAKQVSLKPPDY